MDTVISWMWLVAKVLLFFISLRLGIVYIEIIIPYRLFVWLVFWIIERLWKLSMSLEGIGWMTIDNVKITTKNFELVSVSRDQCLLS